MPLSEALLADLRERLQRQGRVPELPAGWHSQTAMVASHGVRLRRRLPGRRPQRGPHRLEVILVDVCGKGTAAGPAALQFAGALGGLLGALPPAELFRAANDFLLRQHEDEQFATAVHLLVDLERGHLRDHQRGPPAGAALRPADAGVGHRQRPRHRARACSRTPSCTGPRAGSSPARR